MSAFRTTTTALILALTGVLPLPGGVCSIQAAPPDQERPPAPQTPRRVLSPVIPRQPADDVLQPFEPKSPPTEQDKARRESMSWYMAGQLRESRNEFDAARGAYRKAIEADPQVLPPYESLVSIAFTQPSQREEANKYALQAAEHAAGGVALLRGLAGLYVRENQTAQAVELLATALEKTSSLSGVDVLLLHRDSGMFSQLVGDTQAALKHYRTVYETLQSPDSPIAEDELEDVLGDAGSTYESMGKVFLEAKLPDLAVASFEQAAKFQQGRPGVHSFNLATVYKETGEPQKALDELQTYFDAQLQTKGREAYQLLKDLLAETGQSDKLLPRLEELHEGDPRNVALRYFLAEIYQQQDQLDEAEQLLKETIGDGADPRGLVGLASLYRQKGDGKALYDVLRKAYQTVPQPDEDESDLLERMDSDMRAVVEQFRSVQQQIADDKPVMEKLLALGRERKAADNGTFEFLDAYMLGKLAGSAELIEAAKEFYNLAIDMQNDPVPALFRELGFLLTDAERYGEAADVFTAAVTHTSPRLQSPAIQSFFQYLRSHALEMDGQTAAALEAIREARKSQPDNPGLHFQEAWVHYHSHNFEEAIAEFEKIIDTYGGAEDESTQQTVRNSRYSLSAIYVQTGDEVKGEEILQEVYRAHPDDTQVNNDLGYLWADQGRNLKQAREMIEKALKAEPENPAYLDSMGWVLFKLGEYEAALEPLNKAISLPRGEDSTIYDHLGDTYDKLGQRDKAVEAWQKALELEQADSRPDQKIIDRIKSKLGE
jgi:tetratricopeptide (TPR) repeat protein